jgi:hypothetical protein
MRTTTPVIASLFSLALGITEAAGPRAILIEARNLAYDANYRNDQAGLQSAITALQPLVKVTEVSPYAHYYLSWTYWALAASQVQDKNPTGGLESGRRAVEHARAGLSRREKDPEFQTALANALVVVGFLDGSQFKSVMTELTATRQNALQLGPRNPRVVMMDAGVIFNSPPDGGGSKERGLARMQEAMRLFETEANVKAIDPISPTWGNVLAHSGIAGFYLRMVPPDKENARKAVNAALEMRPDFWWIREQVLPQFR